MVWLVSLLGVSPGQSQSLISSVPVQIAPEFSPLQLQDQGPHSLAGRQLLVAAPIPCPSPLHLQSRQQGSLCTKSLLSFKQFRLLGTPGWLSR